MLIGIGLWAAKRIRNETDFLLGGRNLGAWVAGLSYAASTSSAWVLLGFTGFVFSQGVAALWMLPGIWGGYVAVWVWFGPRLRSEASDNEWLTLTDFLCARIEGKWRGRIAALAATLILFCFIFYIAAQFDAAAAAFVSHFSMGKTSSLLLGAGIILVYCLLGGFWAASVTDTLQAVVMLAAAILVPVVVLWHAGGPAEIIAALSDADSAVFTDWQGGMPGYLFAGFVLGVWGIGLGALGQPQLVARLMAVRGERERRQGFVIAISWAVLIFTGMAVLAISARSLLIEPDESEQIFFIMAGRYLPPVLAGIVIAAILSAVMSTVDSLLLAASASVSHDLQLARRSGLDSVWLSRLVMTAIVAIAVILALLLPDTIFNRVLFAWSALGAAFGPLLVMRVLNYEPAANSRFWSIVSGFAVTVGFYTLGTFENGSSSGLLGSLVQLALLPGDPFERVVPWIAPLLILWFSRKSSGGQGDRRAPERGSAISRTPGDDR